MFQLIFRNGARCSVPEKEMGLSAEKLSLISSIPFHGLFAMASHVRNCCLVSSNYETKKVTWIFIL